MINTREITRTAVMVTASVLLGYIESLFPPPIALPGIKLGLANAVIILTLYTASIKKAWLVSLMKVILCAALFGTMNSFIYSLSGAAVSLAVMMLAKKTGLFSIIGVSSAGGIFHNLAQLLCAYFFIGKGALFYIPMLCLSGALCGVFTGIAAQLVIKRGRSLFGEK